jgi:LysR family transcriptional regulator for metE and metH
VFAHESSPQDVRLMRDILVEEGTTMPDVQLVPLTDTMVDLVAAGLGAGLASRWAVAPHEASGRIVARRFTKAGIKERWVAAYRRDSSARLPLARLVEIVRGRPPLGVTLQSTSSRRNGRFEPSARRQRVLTS